ncbi:MAG: hypothetical protein HC811_13135 [Flammeovirgaceae bacterium]|nr:hypothetical protein [Flammeovirgaceae bacterium]
MIKLIKYHLITIFPLILIISLYIYEVIGTGPFALLALLYGLVYRPIIDFRKLRAKGLVGKKEFLNSFGFIRFKFYKELMFEE